MAASTPGPNVLTSTAYLRDRFLPFDQANVSIGSSPVLYGLGVYTVLSAGWDPRAARLTIFRLPDHYQRLVKSCQIMGFPALTGQYSYTDFESVVMSLLQRNRVREDVLVRVGVFVDELLAGARINGLKTSLSMYVYPTGEILSRRGINAGVSSWTKPGDNAIPPRAKVTGAYAAAGLIKNEALLNGYDEAIILDSLGHVSEATIANIFLVRGRELITPSETDNVLEGITRSSIFEMAAHLGLSYRTATVDRTELYTADELFLCGSSARIVPVLSVDHRPVGAGQIGPITAQLAQLYQAIQTGQSPDFAHWLTPVRQSALNYAYEPGRKRRPAELPRNR